MITKPIKLKDIVVEFTSRSSLVDEKLDLDIKMHGVIVPILVEGPDQNGKFLIIDGNLRYKSCERLGIRTINCQIGPLTDEVIRGLIRLRLHVRYKKKTGYNLEREIIFLMDRGLSDVEIANELDVSLYTIRKHLKSRSLPEELKRKAESNKVGKENITKIYNMSQFPDPIHANLVLDCLNKRIKTNEVNAIAKLSQIPLLQELENEFIVSCINHTIEKAVFTDEDAKKTVFLEAVKDKRFSCYDEVTSYAFSYILSELIQLRSLSTPHFENLNNFEQRQRVLTILEELVEIYRTFYWEPFPEKGLASIDSLR